MPFDTGTAIWVGIEYLIGLGLFTMIFILKKSWFPFLVAIWWIIPTFDRWSEAEVQYDLNCNLAYFAMAMIVISFISSFIITAKPKVEKEVDNRSDFDKKYDEWSKKNDEFNKRMEMIRSGRPRKRHGGWGSEV